MGEKEGGTFGEKHIRVIPVLEAKYQYFFGRLER